MDDQLIKATLGSRGEMLASALGGPIIALDQLGRDPVAECPDLAGVDLSTVHGVIVGEDGKARAIIFKQATLAGKSSGSVRRTNGAALQIAAMLASMNPGTLEVRQASRGNVLKINKSFAPAWWLRANKASRYEPCGCGSGKKFKFCCGSKS